MHVLVIPSWFPSRKNPVYGTFFHEQVKALEEKVDRVGVIVPNHSRGNITGPIKRLLTLGLSFSCENYDGLQVWSENNYLRLAYHFKSYKWAVERCRMKMVDNYIKQCGLPNVIHAHSIFDGGVMAAQIKKKYGIPVVVTEHFSGFVTVTEASRIKEINRVLEASDHLISVGSQLAASLQNFSPGINMSVVGNIVDGDFFQIRDKPDKSKVFRFCMIASLTKNKAIDIVIKAMASGFKDQQIELCVGGTGEQEASLRALCNELGVTNQVHFMGALGRDNVRDLIQQSDVLISASHIETFGITLVEALACGKPVIATCSGGPEDILNPDVGILIPVGDVPSMRKAMQSMHCGAKDYDSRQLRKHALSHYGKDVIMRQLLSIYEGVVYAK